MTSPIAAIGAISPIGAAGSSTASSAVSGTGSSFADALSKGLQAVSDSQNKADSLAVSAASGGSVDPSAVTVAATEAQLMTQLASTIQSKAVTSLNTIMGMQL